MAYVLALGLLAGLIWGTLKKFDRNSNSPVVSYLCWAIGIACGVLMPYFPNGVLALAAALMLMAFTGMIFCARNKSNTLSQPIAIVLLVVVLGGMATILGKTMGSGDIQRLMENELRYSKAGAYVFGKALGEKFPQKRALIIASRNYEKNSRDKEIVESLKKGMGDDIKVLAVDWPTLTQAEKDKQRRMMGPMGMVDSAMRDSANEDMFMMDEMLNAEHYDRLIAKHSDCDMVITLRGLPYNVGEMKLWSMPAKKRPMVALVLGDIFMLRGAIKAGYICALTYKPDIKFTEDACPKDVQKAFDERYMIVMPDNIDAISKQYPKYFSELK